MQSYKELLKEFISYKSVSTDPQFASEIEATVNWLRDLFEEHGFEVELVRGYDNPLVIASYVADEKFETCLVYGHYDVQPAELEEGWNTEPFDLVKKDGRYYGRGTVDNKGQVLIHIYSVLKLIESGNIGYNVKFLLEGNEETGSPNISRFFNDHKDKLVADFALVSDGELGLGYPSVELGYRGVFNCTVKVTTSDKDLHSGLYGSTVPSAPEELVKLLVKLKKDDNYINIPGFYNDVKEMTKEEQEFSEKIPFEMAEFKKVTGVSALITEEGLNQYAQNVFRPAMEITTLRSGYMGEGYRNSIPGYAEAKFNFRLTPNQDPERCAQVFKEYVENTVPSYCEVEVVLNEAFEGVELDYENVYVDKAVKILDRVYDKEVLHKHCGAIVPIVVLIADILKIPQAVIPLGNEDCNMHAANENYDISFVENALEFSEKFFSSK